MRPVAVTRASAAQNGQRRGCQSVTTHAAAPTVAVPSASPATAISASPDHITPRAIMPVQRAVLLQLNAAATPKPITDAVNQKNGLPKNAAHAQNVFPSTARCVADHRATNASP